MANFDLAEMALKSVCPNNALKYDDKEMPSVMVYIPKFRLCDVLSTSDTSTHPAFRVNGKEIDGFWVGKYQSKCHDGRAYSLPGEDPRTSAGLDKFIAENRAKGGTYHEITNAEWAAIALWSQRNGTKPLGNNNYGKDYSETLYKAIPSSGKDVYDRIQRVATGTGPVTWSHDGTVSGVWDMNGNVWQWVSGIRLVYGELQILNDNDAAAPDADLGATSTEWKAIRASDGVLVTPNSQGTTEGTVKLDYTSSRWKYSTTVSGTRGAYGCAFKDVYADESIGAATKVMLQSLAMLPDTDLIAEAVSSTFYIDNKEAERYATRGGRWGHGKAAGIFHMQLSNRINQAQSDIGGRSALYEQP